MLLLDAIQSLSNNANQTQIFCVHGGLSPSLNTMDDIRNVSRPSDIPDYGLMNDLLWSDPSDIAAEWEDNERGVSYCFGKAIVTEFLAKHDFDLVCRAHMVVEEGMWTRVVAQDDLHLKAPSLYIHSRI